MTATNDARRNPPKPCTLLVLGLRTQKHSSTSTGILSAIQTKPRHPSLQFKRVHATLPIYSARVNLDYRALGILRDDAIVWFWIGPHDEYKRILNQS